MAASNSQSQVSPGPIMIFHDSTRATVIPTIGVHKPNISKMPDPRRIAEVIVAFSGGSPHISKPARTTSTHPVTSRISNNPVPGQPPANVEYKRRNMHLVALTRVPHVKAHQYPKESRNPHPLEFAMQAAKVAGWRGHSSMIPFFRPIMAAWLGVSAPILIVNGRRGGRLGD